MENLSLPFIDEYSCRIQAPEDVIWKSLLRILKATMRDGQWFAQLLGCNPLTETQSFEGNIDETLPGFRVDDSELGEKLSLSGSHRFASYKLVFIIDGENLRALTYADFPGVVGQIYKTAVIRSGAHRFVTQRLLSQVARKCNKMRVP
jgi:hypothetical protein